MRSRPVPEFRRRVVTRSAGFVPSDSRADVELWQVWCRNAETGEERRATYDDIRRARKKGRR
jgi:hypothetical protein